MASALDFHEPVVIRIGGTTLTPVRNPVEASKALNEAWPDTRGKWYYAANRACRAAAEGRTSVHIARRIFLQAAEESRIQG